MTPPNNITLSKDKKLLTVSFKEDDYALTSEFLRVYSPSAEVRGHGPGQETLQLNKQDVSISSLVPMGNYAIAIHFIHGVICFIWELKKKIYGLIIAIKLVKLMSITKIIEKYQFKVTV